MIEAVNSSLVSAQILRGNAGQVSASHAAVDISPSVVVGSAPEAPKAPYISPYISVDLSHNKAVLQIRDSDTGDVTQQFPSESRLAQLSRVQARQERAQQVSSADLPSTSEVKVSALPSNSQAIDVVTVQDITSASAPANISLPSPSPQIAAAALSAGAQSGQSASISNVSVIV